MRRIIPLLQSRFILLKVSEARFEGLRCGARGASRDPGARFTPEAPPDAAPPGSCRDAAHDAYRVKPGRTRVRLGWCELSTLSGPGQQPRPALEFKLKTNQVSGIEAGDGPWSRGNRATRDGNGRGRSVHCSYSRL